MTTEKPYGKFRRGRRHDVAKCLPAWENLSPGATLACLVAMGIFPTNAGAAEEAEFFDELPVVLTVSRLAQPVSEAPGAVTVIDQELIRASGARILSDILRLVPGFQVTPPNQEAPRVTYHGLTEEYPSRLQVLVDGRSQYSPLYQGGVNWNMMPVALEDIERIEVIRGSNSAAYGANAYMGVVNIITQQAAQARGSAVSYSSGNGRTRDLYARHGWSAPGADFRLSFRAQEDNGLDSQVDDRHNQTLDFRADLHVSARDEVQVNLGGVRNLTNYGSANNNPCNPMRDFDSREVHLQAGWRHDLGNDQELQVNYNFTREAATDAHRELCGSDLYDVNYGGHASRQELEAQHTLAPSKDTRLVWGGGLYWENVDAPFYYYSSPHQQRQIQRVFANLEWRIDPRWLANLGGSWEHDSLDRSRLAPRATLHHHFAEGHTLRFGVSQAYRAPTLYEARTDYRWIPLGGGATDYAQVARPGLQAEKVNSQEIGYIGQFDRLGLSVDARLFRESIPNRIQTVPRRLESPYCTNPIKIECDDADYAVNGERVSVRGIEYQMRWQAGPDTRFLFNQTFQRISGTLLDIQVDDTPSNVAKITTQTVNSAPSHNTVLMWMQRLPYNLDFSATYQAMGAMQWTRNTMIPAYHRVDWRLAYRFRMGTQNAELAYTGRSTGEPHGEFRSNQLVTPRHFMTLRIGF